MATRPLAPILGLLLTCSAAQAAGHGVKELSPDHLTIGPGELSVGVSQQWQQPLPQVQRALIVIHGRLRNAQTYLHSAEQAAIQAGKISTYISTR